MTDGIGSAGGLPPADWYDDPDNPSQLRYWDGETWTDHFAPRPVSAGLRPISDWLSDTFGTLRSCVKSLLMVSAVWAVPAVFLVSFALAWLAFPIRVSGLISEDFDIAGFSVTRAVIAGVLVLVATLCTVGWQLSVLHQIYWAHRGVDAAWNRSAAAGLARLPHAILWFVVFMVAFTVVAMAIVLLAVLSPWLLLITVPLALVGLVYLYVRLQFVPLVVAVGRSGKNPVRASLDATAGNFWPLLGRFIVLALVVAAVGIGFNLIQNQVTVLAFSGLSENVELVGLETSDPKVQIDGRSVDAFGPQDVFGSAAGLALRFVAIGLFSMVSQAVTNSITGSGVGQLYVDLNGEASEAP